MARGEWLAFLDADDDWAPDKLAKQLALAEDHVGLIYTDRLNFGDFKRLKERQSDGVTLWEGDVFEPLLLGNFITLSSVLLRKDLVRASRRLLGEASRGPRLGPLVAIRRLRRGRETLQGTPDPVPVASRSDEQRIGSPARERVEIIRRALAMPHGRHIRRSVIRQALANSCSIAAWQSMIDRPWMRMVWYVRSAYYWPWNLGTYKGIIKCCLGMN